MQRGKDGSTAPNIARRLRLMLGKSSQEIADAIGIHVSQLLRYEQHGFGLGPKKRERLAAYFGLQRWQLDDLTLPERCEARDGEIFVRARRKPLTK